MKMFTNSDQTAKLIELGVTQPRTKIPFEVGNYELGYTYSIGELIEMLPSVLDNHKQLCIESSSGKWWVAYINLWDKKYLVRKDELIDALYAMILQLREEGVI